MLRSLALILLVSLGGCDKTEGGDGKDGGVPAATAAPTAAEAKAFSSDQSKKGCEMLPPATVAKVLEVPEAELKQMKIAGCIYSWKSADDSQSAEASITMISVKKDVAKASTQFDNATRDQSAAEIAAQLGTVMKATKQNQVIDSKAKEDAVDQVGGMMASMIPDAGYQYEDVAGVGDAARALQHDGAVTVRVGNMIFNVKAYKGAPAPGPDMTGVDISDMDAVMAVAKQAEAKWLEQTREVRKQRSVELAKAIVAGL